MSIYRSSLLLPSWQESSLKSRFRSPIGEKSRDLTAAIQALTFAKASPRRQMTGNLVAVPQAGDYFPFLA